MTSQSEITLLSLLVLIPFATAAPSLDSACAADLVTFSPCLPLVSSPPNNFTTAVPQNCCDAISIFNFTVSGDSCIGQLLCRRRINPYRVLLLQSVCLGMATRSPVLLSTCSSVDFGGKSVSEHEEAIRKCIIVIKEGCTDEKCCWHLCEKYIPYAKTVDVSYKVINGAYRCYCHAIYKDKPGSCAP